MSGQGRSPGADHQKGPTEASTHPEAMASPEARVVLFATRNQGKLAELQALARPLGLRVLGVSAFADLPPVQEDGETFEHNALKKARVIAAATRLPTLADDSGLVVDALGGEPGVRSARYSGPDATDETNNRLLLERMSGVNPEERTAHFECVLAFVDPTRVDPSEGVHEIVHLARGRCDGILLDAPRGEGGFGYDPLFFVPELDATFAELPRSEKNRVSHRARAVASMASVLRSHFGLPPRATFG